MGYGFLRVLGRGGQCGGARLRKSLDMADGAGMNQFCCLSQRKPCKICNPPYVPTLPADAVGNHGKYPSRSGSHTQGMFRILQNWKLSSASCRGIQDPVAQ